MQSTRRKRKCKGRRRYGGGSSKRQRGGDGWFSSFTGWGQKTAAPTTKVQFEEGMQKVTDGIAKLNEIKGSIPWPADQAAAAPATTPEQPAVTQPAVAQPTANQAGGRRRRIKKH